MTDKAILDGFNSLHQAVAEGFGRVDQRFIELEARIVDLGGRMNGRFAGLEARMMRRFDERDVRIEDHEHRITHLEANR